ncbi:MAG TPA: cytochrome c [Bryobacteraceae bacterium]|jgi:mono/diheme cytochrome c family protein
MRAFEFVPIFAFGLLFQSLGAAQAVPPKRTTVWDGIFDQAEVTRGGQAYNSRCSGCHGDDLSRLGGVLQGDKFMEHWREDNLANLFNTIRSTMPPGPRGGVSEAEYVDILAYLLERNGFPTGKAALNPGEFERILIVGKEGPQPVPDFSLVTVAGCLGRDGENRWVLTNASEPLRTRNPREPTDKETAADMIRKGGEHTFHFLDTYEFPTEFKAGQWTVAKGFLIRSPGNDRINLTWLKGLRPTCKVGP